MKKKRKEKYEIENKLNTQTYKEQKLKKKSMDIGCRSNRRLSIFAKVDVNKRQDLNRFHDNDLSDQNSF
jgi:hypothetical protein